MDKAVKTRLAWIKSYEQTGKLGVVCNKCGISRPTLRKWLKRYQAKGIAGLEACSRRPNDSPNQKMKQEDIQLILKLQTERKLGARRLQTELQLKLIVRLGGVMVAVLSVFKLLSNFFGK